MMMTQKFLLDTQQTYIYCGERADKLDGTIASLEYEIGEIEDILKQHREAIVEIQVKLIPQESKKGAVKDGYTEISFGLGQATLYTEVKKFCEG